MWSCQHFVFKKKENNSAKVGRLIYFRRLRVENDLSEVAVGTGNVVKIVSSPQVQFSFS